MPDRAGRAPSIPPSGPETPGGVSVVTVRGSGTPAIDSASDEPIPPVAAGIDQGQSSTGLRPGPASDLGHRMSSKRKSTRKDVAVRADDGLDLLTREGHEPENDPSWPNPDPLSSIECRALVPAGLPLDQPDVVEPRLDLDDQHDAGPRIEREQIDPTVRPGVDDLDLTRRLPSSRPQPTIDVT